MDAISLEHIAKIYRVPSLLPWKTARRVEALRDITVRVPGGKISCLLGPNGAGKTTIVKILAGLIEPDRGEGRVLGRPLAELDRGTRGSIGFLTANDRSFYWRLTGRQNLDFFASLHGLKGGDRKQRVREVLADVGLEEQADTPFRLYSSGMKQKLLMARALLGRPELLLLDEPTAHLDHSARTAMHRFIRERLIRARKASVLLCTNDLAEAQKLADHLILIDEGRVLAEGPLDSLRSPVRSSPNLTLSFEKAPARGWDRRLGIRLLRRAAGTMVFAVPREVRTADVVAAAVRHGGRLVGCRSRRGLPGRGFRAHDPAAHMSKLLAFLRKDLLTTLSYRFDLLLSLLGIFLTVAMFYFIGRTFDGALAPHLARYGGEYFPYVLIGIAVSNFVTVGMSALSRQARSAQVEGTLEALLGTPTSIYTVLIGNSLWSFLTALGSAVALIGAGFLVIRLEVSLVRAAAAVSVLLLTFLAFLMVGMLSASFVIVFKRGDPIGWIFGWSSFLLGGVLFPVEVLPAPLPLLSRFLPITYAIEAIREILLARASFASVLPPVLALCLFAVVLAPVSVLFFRYAVHRARKDGNLVQF